MKAAAHRPGGSWMAQNYDKLALVAVLVALLVSGLLLTLRMGGQRKGFDARFNNEMATQGKPAQVLDTSAVSNLLMRLADPFQVPVASRRLMVGDVRVASIPSGAPILFSASVDPFDGSAQPTVDFDPDSDGDGISDKLELQYGLNPADPTDAQGDLDGDGYSNLEEILAGTDPTDPTSFPPPVAKLRLVRTVVNPFRLLFLGTSQFPDGARYQLNLRSGGRTYFAQLGETIEGYTVKEFIGDAPEGPALVLEKDGSAIRLVQGRAINQEARTALLVFLLDGSRYRVQVNDDIQLKDLTYKVVDIREDRIVIRGEQDGKLTTVGLLTSDERARLQGGGGSTAEPTGAAFP